MQANHAWKWLRRNEQMQRLLEQKQNELPPNTSWPDVLEEKLTPSEDTTGKWVASTTSFERKGLRFGMESSAASAEVKGSRQTEKNRDREQKTDRTEWRGRRRYQSQTTTREEEHAEEVQKHTCWVEEPALYLPTLLPLEAQLSLTAWRAGKLIAGQKGHSPSSLRCNHAGKNNWLTDNKDNYSWLSPCSLRDMLSCVL